VAGFSGHHVPDGPKSALGYLAFPLWLLPEVSGYQRECDMSLTSKLSRGDIITCPLCKGRGVKYTDFGVVGGVIALGICLEQDECLRCAGDGYVEIE
jgi:hypothetical protein